MTRARTPLVQTDHGRPSHIIVRFFDVVYLGPGGTVGQS